MGIKIKKPISIPSAMPMNTSKDAEEAFDRLKKEDDRLQNDSKRLQKDVSKRILQRKETAADRILQKQFKQLQEAQAETNFDECMDTKSMISSLDQTTAQCDGTDSSIPESFLPTASTEMKQPVFNPSSSNQAEDAAISVPSDNCDYMELECQIEPYDDDSLTPVPPEISTDTKKSTAIVAPIVKKGKTSRNDLKKEPNKSKTQRKQDRRVLTIRVKKLKEKDANSAEDGCISKDVKEASRNQLVADDPSSANISPETVESHQSDLKGKTKEKAKKQATDPSSKASPLKARKRKRKANKTGFPSVKKKKKKQNPFVDSDKSSSRSSSTPRTSRPSSVAEVRESKKVAAAPVRSSSRVQALEETKKILKVEESVADDTTQTMQVASVSTEGIHETSLTHQSKDDLNPTISVETSEEPIIEERIEKTSAANAIKKPRGRPPKKRQTLDLSSIQNEEPKENVSLLALADKISTVEEDEPSLTLDSVCVKRPREESEESQRSSKRSRLYTDEVHDDDIDCLALLPTTGMESGLSSEAPSVAGSETEGDSKSTCSSSTNSRK